jgi:hypothetical protein
VRWENETEGFEDEDEGELQAADSDGDYEVP